MEKIAIKKDEEEEEAALKSDLKKLREDYSSCVLEHWQGCVLGIAVGLPASVIRKSQVPWMVGGVSGTLVDYFRALGDCKSIRHEMLEKERRLGIAWY